MKKTVEKVLSENRISLASTDDKKVVLMTFFADCVPLFFYDPVKKAIGASHSGWRGSVKRIGEKTVRRMEEEFGSNPKDILR